MSKILISFIVISLSIVVTSSVSAKGSPSQGSQPTVVTGKQIQNKGENTQIQTSTREKERSETAIDHQSAVSEKVEELLTTKSAKGGIGQQISEFAQTQTQDQDEIVATINQLDARAGLVKRLIGSDLKAVKKLNQQLERNQERVKQLEQLKLQVSNSGDQTKLREMIEVLNQENTFLQDQIKLEENIPSLFGWLIKLFNK